MSSKENKIIKHLRFELTPKEYSDFYYIGYELLKSRHKHDILKKIMEIAKKELES